MSRRLPIANDDRAASMDDGDAPPDHVRPFMLETSQLRGRILRLPGVIDAILAAHDYPDPIARLLAEALCLTSLLAGMLKFDGVFTLQAKGNGIVKTLICDLTRDGAEVFTLRGYAGYDRQAYDQLGEISDFTQLTQGGYLAFTVDQATGTDRYQGIVTLEGETLTECVLNYFRQSEQIRTGFMTFIDRDAAGRWTGGGMMLQHLAREGGHESSNKQSAAELENMPSSSATHDRPSIEDRSQVAQSAVEPAEDDWQRMMLLMQTLGAGEMLDGATSLNTILYRLFHEEGVRVFDPIAIVKACRCSREKIAAVLDALSPEERIEYAENSEITVTCEFCNTVYTFPVEKNNG